MATMMMNMENIMMLLLHSIGKRCNDWHGEFPAIDILASVPDLQSFNHQHMRLHLHDQRLDQCPICMISKISDVFILSKTTYLHIEDLVLDFPFQVQFVEESDEDEKGGGVFEQDGSGSISYR